MNRYQDTFRNYIMWSVQYALSKVQVAEAILSKDDREQALHALSYAFKMPETWSYTRDLLLAMAPKMERAGFRDEWIPYLKKGTEQSQLADDTAAKAALSLHIGVLYQLVGKYDVAQTWLSTSVADFTQLEDPHNQVRALNELAYVAFRQRKYNEALRLVESVFELVDEENPERAGGYYIQGEIALTDRDWTQAEKYLRKALRLREIQGDQRRIAWGLRNLGLALYRQEKYDEAILGYLRAIEILEQIDDQVNAAATRMNLGIIYSLQGKPTEALEMYLHAEPTFRNAHDDLRLAMLYTNKAIEFRHLQQWASAEQTCRFSIERWKKIGDIELLINAMHELGLIYLEQGHLKKARSIYENAMTELTAIKDSRAYQHLYELLTAHLHKAEFE